MTRRELLVVAVVSAVAFPVALSSLVPAFWTWFSATSHVSHPHFFVTVDRALLLVVAIAGWLRIYVGFAFSGVQRDG